MMRKGNFILTAAAICLATFSSEAWAAEGKSVRPNVLFLAVDDLNDWVGYLGGHPQAHTPHLDQLAAEGITFTNAYCAAPVCGPSRTALMYGLAPHRSGSYGHHAVYEPGNLLDDDRLPLNLVFQKNGYETAGCGKIFHYRETRGWDHEQPGARGMVSPDRKRIGGLSWGILPTDDDRETEDGKLTDWAIGQLKRDHGKPFFIALGLKKPHLPWEAPRKYFERLEGQDIVLPKVPEGDLDDLPEAGRVFAKSLVGFRSPDDHREVTKVPGAWQDLVRAYLATSSFADANVGRILQALRESPHRDNTIVVLWGDHGWHLGEKEHWRKMTLWERGTRTPLIIRIPGAAPARVEAPVSLQDLFPTLVDLCGLDCEQEIDGNSLKPLLDDPSRAWDKSVLISHGPGNFAVRKGPWRLIHYAGGGEELYHLPRDPGEWVNLIDHPDHQAVRKELQKALPRTWRHVMGPRFKNFPDSFAAPAEADGPGR